MIPMKKTQLISSRLSRILAKVLYLCKTHHHTLKSHNLVQSKFINLPDVFISDMWCIFTPNYFCRTILLKSPVWPDMVGTLWTQNGQDEPKKAIYQTIFNFKPINDQWTNSVQFFITARKRSLGQGNIFAPVCHSVQGGVPGQVPPGTRYTPGDQVHTPSGPGTPPQDQVPARQVHPLRSSACWEIRATSGRYASYWNAILYFLSDRSDSTLNLGSN